MFHLRKRPEERWSTAMANDFAIRTAMRSPIELFEAKILENAFHAAVLVADKKFPEVVDSGRTMALVRSMQVITGHFGMMELQLLGLVWIEVANRSSKDSGDEIDWVVSQVAGAIRMADAATMGALALWECKDYRDKDLVPYFLAEVTAQTAYKNEDLVKALKILDGKI